MRLLGLVTGAIVIRGSAISFAAPDLRLSLERSVVSSADWYRLPPYESHSAWRSYSPRQHRRRSACSGSIVIIAGITTPWFGVDHARAVVNGFANAGPLLMRLEASVRIALGGFLVYVFRTSARAT